MAKDPYRKLGINTNFDLMGAQNRIIKVDRISLWSDVVSYYDSNRILGLKVRGHRLSKQRVRINKKRGWFENG